MIRSRGIAIIFCLASLGVYCIQAMSPVEVAQLRAQTLRAQAEAARLEADALQAELEAAELTGEIAPTVDEQVPVGEGIDEVLLAFAQEFKKLTGQEIALDAKVAEIRGKHGWSGRGGMRGRGMHGPGRMSLSELIAELNKPEHEAALPPYLKMALIRWSWRIVRWQELGDVPSEVATLVPLARTVLDKVRPSMGEGWRRGPGFGPRFGGPGMWRGGEGRPPGGGMRRHHGHHGPHGFGPHGHPR